MGIARLRAAGIEGVEGYPVDIEVDVAGGLPQVVVVGLPDLAVRESRDRVKAAINNTGLAFPIGRITVNLAPARRRKDGAAFDLPIALGVLAAAGHLPPERLVGVAALGELSLAGRARPVRGALAAAEALARAGTRRLIITGESAREAALAVGSGGAMEILPVRDLAEAIALLRGELAPQPLHVDLDSIVQGTRGADDLELADVHGNYTAKRALLVAAAGGHDLLLVGPPGAGKTMLARRLLGILPPLDRDEILEITRVHGSIGAVPAGGIVTRRPFRAPHHTTSYVGLVGGGSVGPRPGEVSLAHRGVLFLDELPEFPSRALEALREPLESRTIHVARAWGSIVLPADFQLVGAMNPCACGYSGDPRRACRCGSMARTQYGARLSGPLLDRLDLQVTVRPPDPESLFLAPRDDSLTTAQAARLVRAARARQRARGWLNARIPSQALDEVSPLAKGPRDLLVRAARASTLSARGIIKVKRVARTVADLEGHEQVTSEDMAEALLLRHRDEPVVMAAREEKPAKQVRASS
ncbi:MAG TPA: YifB family Mg chelatase-like AAA ATPase [Planctomycetota bacterium]|nr:YifB family Mg chelatase-like AAA ATPase [Planctomycetota bacterium]